MVIVGKIVRFRTVKYATAIYLIAIIVKNVLMATGETPARRHVMKIVERATKTVVGAYSVWRGTGVIIVRTFVKMPTVKHAIGRLARSVLNVNMA